MAKGKQAVRAANRRAEEAHKTIDMLTTELAVAKLRARQAEQRANRVERVEALGEKTRSQAEALVPLLKETIEDWQQIAKADQRRRRLALEEVYSRLIADVALSYDIMGLDDQRQFLQKRYPHMMAALVAIDRERTAKFDDVPIPVHGTSVTMAEQKMSGDRLARFQRLVGHRATLISDPDKNFADIEADLLDARQAGFSTEEMMEFAIGDGPSDS